MRFATAGVQPRPQLRRGRLTQQVQVAEGRAAHLIGEVGLQEGGGHSPRRLRRWPDGLRLIMLATFMMSLARRRAAEDNRGRNPMRLARPWRCLRRMA
jgi:hypothetical protein